MLDECGYSENELSDSDDENEVTSVSFKIKYISYILNI